MVSETPARPARGSGVSPGPVQADEVFRIIRERLAGSTWQRYQPSLTSMVR